MKLVLVESPAKAKSINKYLGSEYDVMATVGHIRNLPNKVVCEDSTGKINCIFFNRYEGYIKKKYH